MGYLLPLLAQARYQDAESLARQILAGDPGNYYANLRLAVVLRWQRKYAEAEEIVARMLDTYPADTPLMLEMGLLCVAQDKKPEARNWLSDVLALAPDNATAAERLRAVVAAARRQELEVRS